MKITPFIFSLSMALTTTPVFATEKSFSLSCQETKVEFSKPFKTLNTTPNRYNLFIDLSSASAVLHGIKSIVNAGPKEITISNTYEIGETENYGIKYNIKKYSLFTIDRKNLDFVYKHTTHAIAGNSGDFQTRKSLGTCELMKVQDGNKI